MIWVCEYSPEQGVFHVDTLSRILEINRRTLEDGSNPGFIPLHIARTSADAHAFAEQWRREHPEGGHDGR